MKIFLLAAAMVAALAPAASIACTPGPGKVEKYECRDRDAGTTRKAHRVECRRK